MQPSLLVVSDCGLSKAHPSQQNYDTRVAFVKLEEGIQNSPTQQKKVSTVGRHLLNANCPPHDEIVQTGKAHGFGSLTLPSCPDGPYDLGACLPLHEQGWQGLWGV